MKRISKEMVCLVVIAASAAVIAWAQVLQVSASRYAIYMTAAGLVRYDRMARVFEGCVPNLDTHECAWEVLAR